MLDGVQPQVFVVNGVIVTNIERRGDGQRVPIRCIRQFWLPGPMATVLLAEVDMGALEDNREIASAVGEALNLVKCLLEGGAGPDAHDNLPGLREKLVVAAATLQAREPGLLVGRPVPQV